MTTKRLHYFDVNGLGEAIRYLLHYGGVKFEDVRYSHEEWPEIKKTLPFGQLPVYEDGNKRLNQSLAIARYIGTTLGLVAGDIWKDAKLDAIVLTIYDYWQKVVAYIKAPNKETKDAIKKELETETIKFFFSQFEKELLENGGYFAGKLTWADFVLVGFVEASNHFLGFDVAANYPAIKKLIDTILNFPNVKKYIDSK